MKKILLFVCAVSITAFSHAQVRFGAKAGANFASVNGDIDGTKSKVGFNAGLVSKISVSEAFSIQPELVYSTQGAKIEELDANVNLDYINLPVLFQYNTKIGFFAETGPQVGYLLSAKIKAGDQSEDMKDDFKSIDFAWSVGIGWQMQGSGLGLNARYNIGLGKINDSEGDEKVTNGVFQVGFFYMFGRPSRD
jgi:hypothetical protein